MNMPIADIKYALGGSGTDVIATGLPEGLVGSYANGSFVISGTPTKAGHFDFIVKAIGACNNPTLTGSIFVDEEPSQANAGADQEICSYNNVILNAVKPLIGTGKWSKLGSFPGNITDPNQFTTSVLGLAPGSYTFVWTVSNGTCNASSDGVVVNIKKPCNR